MLGSRYALRQRLGAGGMARVYLADDTLLGRTVAIKMLHDELATNAEVSARFIREARIFARLEHPNIVGIYDVLVPEDGPAAMVMEYVEGTDLSKVLRGKPKLVPELAALIVQPIAEALSYAHGNGVVHRDVKPANVLLRRDGTVKLSDFGIARATDEQHLTQTGDFLGTPAYIAPEQAKGEQVTAAVDQYALGVVLYQLVTGSCPFTGPNTLAVLTKIMTGQYPDPRTLNGAVDERLASIIARAIAHRPEDRYPDLRAFVGALDGYRKVTSVERAKSLLASLVEDPDATFQEAAHEVADSFVTTGKRALDDGDVAEARRAAEAALARRPDHVEAQALLRTTESHRGGVSAPREGNARGPWVVLVAGLLGASLAGGIYWLLKTGPDVPREATAVAMPAAVARQDAAPPPPDVGVDARVVEPDAAPDAAVEPEASPEPEPPPKRVERRPKPKVKPKPSEAPEKPPPREKEPPREIAARPEEKPEPRPPGPTEGQVKADRRPGTLSLRAAPWADVYIDGKKKGRTPYFKRIELPPGTYRLELKNPGFETHAETFTIDPGGTTNRRIRLGRSR